MNDVDVMMAGLIKMLCVIVNSIEDLRIKTKMTFDNQEDFIKLLYDLNSDVQRIDAMIEEEEMKYEQMDSCSRNH